METKLYILRPNVEEGLKDLWEPWYDKAFGFVVRAVSPEKARELASKESGDEGIKAWLDPAYSSCEELHPRGGEMIIIKDFNAA